MAVSLDYEITLGDPVAGLDEAGRGPLAGRVYAAAVSVPLAVAKDLLTGAWKGINDSKQLSPRKRARLAEVIKSTPECRYAIAYATPEEIDRLNILKATHLAFARAAAALPPPSSHFVLRTSHFAPPSSHFALRTSHSYSLLVDGLPVSTLPTATNVIKGDAKSLFIAAASILAKTARDEDCLRLERLYPGYGFAQHKGYPTAVHYAALARLGPCPEHRRSFTLFK